MGLKSLFLNMKWRMYGRPSVRLPETKDLGRNVYKKKSGVDSMSRQAEDQLGGYDYSKTIKQLTGKHVGLVFLYHSASRWFFVASNRHKLVYFIKNCKLYTTHSL